MFGSQFRCAIKHQQWAFGLTVNYVSTTEFDVTRILVCIITRFTQICNWKFLHNISNQSVSSGQHWTACRQNNSQHSHKSEVFSSDNIITYILISCKIFRARRVEWIDFRYSCGTSAHTRNVTIASMNLSWCLGLPSKSIRIHKFIHATCKNLHINRITASYNIRNRRCSR